MAYFSIIFFKKYAKMQQLNFLFDEIHSMKASKDRKSIDHGGRTND